MVEGKPFTEPQQVSARKRKKGTLRTTSTVPKDLWKRFPSSKKRKKKKNKAIHYVGAKGIKVNGR